MVRPRPEDPLSLEDGLHLGCPGGHSSGNGSRVGWWEGAGNQSWGDLGEAWSGRRAGERQEVREEEEEPGRPLAFCWVVRRLLGPAF